VSFAALTRLEELHISCSQVDPLPTPPSLASLCGDENAVDEGTCIFLRMDDADLHRPFYLGAVSMFPLSLRHLRMDKANWTDDVFRGPGGPMTLLRCPLLETLSLTMASLSQPSWEALFQGTSRRLC